MKRTISIPGMTGLALLAVMVVTVAGVADSAAQNIRRQVDLVTVPAVVIGHDGKLVTGLQPDNFRVLEEGRAREISYFSGEASPLTVVVLVENSARLGYLRHEVAQAADAFLNRAMQKDDYVALVSFDTEPRIEVDFTRNRRELAQSISSLFYSTGGMRESSVYDALAFALQGGEIDGTMYKGLAEVEGRTAVLLISTGIDTLSRITYGDARKVVESSGVPVYTIGVGRLAYTRMEPYLTAPQRMTFLQAQNSLRTFAESSGGRFYSVRFEGALPDVMSSIGAMLRHQYTLGFVPAEPPAQGKKRKIEVRVDTAGDGRPDEDVEVRHRESYRLGIHAG